MRDTIYVAFPSNTGVSGAPTKVSVIHTARPNEDDVITFNPAAMTVWPYAMATALEPDLKSYALFTVFPRTNVDGHAAFLQFIRSNATKLMAIGGSPMANGPRIAQDNWNLYRDLTFSGTPGGPNSYFTPTAAVEGGNLVMRLGGKAILVDQAPPSLPAGTTGNETRIVAVDQRFFVTWLWRESDRFAPAIFYVHDRQLAKWRDLKFSWNLPQSRIFGSWLATIAMSYEGVGSGVWHDSNPGHNDESDHWVKDVLPDVRLEFEDMRLGCAIPGTLILDNLVDGRRIMLETHKEDSEILDVGNDGLVLYRINDEIFSAQIEGDTLSGATLVAKGEDVPQVHWAFWSGTPAEANQRRNND